MSKIATVRIIQSLIFILVFNFMAQAGWVITEESTDSYGNKMIQTIFIQDNFVRYETPSSIAIIDLEKKQITLVFPQYQVYWAGTIQQLKENSIATYDKQMEEMLIGLLPSDRKELDSIYSEIKKQLLDTTTSTINKNISVSETTEYEEILGYNTKKYNIKFDSITVEAVWHTTEIKPYNDIDIDYMISFMKQLNPVSGQGSISNTAEYIDLLKNGMLLKSIEYSPNGNKQIVTVTNIREIDIVSEFFSPPNNYREASFSDILYLMPLLEEESEKDPW